MATTTIQLSFRCRFSAEEDKVVERLGGFFPQNGAQVAGSPVFETLKKTQTWVRPKLPLASDPFSPNLT